MYASFKKDKMKRKKNLKKKTKMLKKTNISRLNGIIRFLLQTFLTFFKKKFTCSYYFIALKTRVRFCMEIDNLLTKWAKIKLLSREGVGIFRGPGLPVPTNLLLDHGWSPNMTLKVSTLYTRVQMP